MKPLWNENKKSRERTRQNRGQCDVKGGTVGRRRQRSVVLWERGKAVVGETSIRDTRAGCRSRGPSLGAVEGEKASWLRKAGKEAGREREEPAVALERANPSPRE